jgi:hypothetical protein
MQSAARWKRRVALVQGVVFLPICCFTPFSEETLVWFFIALQVLILIGASRLEETGNHPIAFAGACAEALVAAYFLLHGTSALRDSAKHFFDPARMTVDW